DATDRSEHALDDVTPVRVHVQGEPAAAAAPIIPARPLARTLPAIEYPPAEIEPEAGHAPEKSPRAERTQLLQSGQEYLVLDGAVLEPACARGAQQGKPLGHRRRHRLFAVDMLAGRDRLAQRRYPLHGRRRVEEHREIRPGQGRIEIGRPAV